MKFLFSVMLMLFALSLFAQDKTVTSHDHNSPDEYKNYDVATFAAGSFWYEEALFESIKGVKEAVCGYAGGTTDNPTYDAVKTGTTGYAETIMIYYDPKVVAYATLAEVFFAAHDPTSLNGQKRNHGTQYRSIAFFRTPFEKQVIENQIRSVNASKKYTTPVVTQVAQFVKFWPAEETNQNYIEKNINRSTTDYIHVVTIPDLKSFQRQYPQLIKPDHLF